MEMRGSTREAVDALVRHLNESRIASSDGYSQQVDSLALDLARADELDSSDERFLTLAEARDTARRLAASSRKSHKDAAEEAWATKLELDSYRSGYAWPSRELYGWTRSRETDALKRYHVHHTAHQHLRLIVRGISRDLAREAAAARARGVPRVTRLSRRLIELALSLRVASDQASRRRRCWSHLDEIGRGNHFRFAQLGYAFRVLIRGLD